MKICLKDKVHIWRYDDISPPGIFGESSLSMAVYERAWRTPRAEQLGGLTKKPYEHPPPQHKHWARS